jgi:hypothetical protein
VEDNSELRYSLNYQAGEEAKELTSQLQTQEQKLKEAGAFRTLLLRQKFDKSRSPGGPARFTSSKEVSDGFAIGTDGVRERLRFVLPVSKDSKSVKLPAADRRRRHREGQAETREAAALHRGAGRRTSGTAACTCRRLGTSWALCLGTETP